MWRTMVVVGMILGTTLTSVLAVALGVWLHPEWVVKASGQGKAGPVKFNVKNAGSIPHEFVVFKTDADAASLTKDANAKVDEAKYSPVGRTKEVAVGTTESLEATLTAGKYVLVCNIAGHYDLGMRTGFTVN